MSGPCGSPWPNSTFPDPPQLRLPPPISSQGWGYRSCTKGADVHSYPARRPDVPDPSIIYLLLFALRRLGPGGGEGMTDSRPGLRAPHPLGSPVATDLLRPRLRRSPQARILFWASMCVRPPAFSPSMFSTQSPTATPACAALPPGVSYGEMDGHGGPRLQTKLRPAIVNPA